MGVKVSIPEGTKFNRLTAIKEVEPSKGNHRRFLWKCDCGTIKEINLMSVKHSNTRSCGCMLREWLDRQQTGENNAAWKGGRYVDSGYVLVYRPDHPNAKSTGYIREHRYVMSEHLGRPLESDENVHHINGDKTDNRLENLELWNTSQPCGQRVSDKVNWAKEILRRYDNAYIETSARSVR